MLDAPSFWSALAAGELGVCLAEVRAEAGSAAPDADRNCRLAEALMHAGRGEEAAECCRRAGPAMLHDPALLRICAWVFSNHRSPDEAAAVYRRLLELSPDWSEGHRHLSSALADAGQADAAIDHAIIACHSAPLDPEYALHAASLLAAAGCLAEAAVYARKAAVEPELAVDAAELLMHGGLADEAAELLDRHARDSGELRALRVLSTAEMMRGQPAAALEAVERALAKAPENAEYRVHQGHILWQLGDVVGASEAFDTAAALDPGAADVKRARMSLYAATGQLRDAVAAGGELLHLFPDDRPSAEAVLHLLNHRVDTIDGDYVVLVPGTARAVRPPRPPPGMLDRWRDQRRVIRALIIRETRTRFADLRLGYGWAVIEPILHIALLSAMFAFLMHGRPPIGRHFFLFYYTGLIRYYGANGTIILTISDAIMVNDIDQKRGRSTLTGLFTRPCGDALVC